MTEVGIGTPLEVGEWLVDVFRKCFSQEDLADKLHDFIHKTQHIWATLSAYVLVGLLIDCGIRICLSFRAEVHRRHNFRPQERCTFLVQSVSFRSSPSSERFTMKMKLISTFDPDRLTSICNCYIISDTKQQ